MIINIDKVKVESNDLIDYIRELLDQNYIDLHSVEFLKKIITTIILDYSNMQYEHVLKERNI